MNFIQTHTEKRNVIPNNLRKTWTVTQAQCCRCPHQATLWLLWGDFLPPQIRLPPAPPLYMEATACRPPGAAQVPWTLKPRAKLWNPFDSSIPKGSLTPDRLTQHQAGPRLWEGLLGTRALGAQDQHRAGGSGLTFLQLLGNGRVGQSTVPADHIPVPVHRDVGPGLIVVRSKVTVGGSKPLIESVLQRMELGPMTQVPRNRNRAHQELYPGTLWPHM